jgi:NAD(P)-dependent dehydrogenase (short-subunit alcohol dehydrogenase family)
MGKAITARLLADVERVAASVDGAVDVLVNNAGGVASRGMPEAHLAEMARAWEADYQSNVISAVMLTQADAGRPGRPPGGCGRAGRLRG